MRQDMEIVVVGEKSSSPQYGEIRLRLRHEWLGGCRDASSPQYGEIRLRLFISDPPPVATSSSPQYGEIRLRHDAVRIGLRDELPHRSTERSDCDTSATPTQSLLVFLTAVRRDPIATTSCRFLSFFSRLPHRSTERSDCDTAIAGSLDVCLFLTAVRRDPIATTNLRELQTGYSFLTAVRRDPIATSTSRACARCRSFLTAVRRDPIATSMLRNFTSYFYFLTAVRRDPIATIPAIVAGIRRLPHRSTERSDCDFEPAMMKRRTTSSPQYGEIRLRLVEQPSVYIFSFLTAVRRDPIATLRLPMNHTVRLPHRSTERSDCDR